MEYTDGLGSTAVEPRREGSAGDAHRPRYHFLPPAGWLNDPNGLIHWQGVYHLFYQHNPYSAHHERIHWGHATSVDLVHWTRRPIALAPTPGSPDEDGCFSGCAVDNDGTPTLVYTGVRGPAQLPCVVTSADDLITWRKHPGNPVIAAPPGDLDLVAFRDHSVWREGDTWYQVIGSGIRDVGGTALLYRSPNLLRWEYLGPIFIGDMRAVDPPWTGTMWECPDFFALEDKHILVVSVWDKEQLLYPVYFTGGYADHAFLPDQVHRLDFGASFYAPQSLCEAGGRRIMWGWLREERDPGAQMAAGWSGVMSLPRILTLRPDGTLDMRPAPELERLRGPLRRVEALALAPSPSTPLEGGRGDRLEIAAEIDPGAAAETGLIVRAAPDQAEQTRIYYDRVRQRLILDGSRSSLSDTARREVHSGPLALAPGEPFRLRIFLDSSVIEVFANERVCLTARVYPVRPDSLGLAVFAEGGAARLITMDMWEMASIWPDEE
jgi:beta-fructofuranosidase